MVSDEATSFNSFTIAFKDEVAHNLNIFGTNPGETAAPVTADDLEQFDIQMKNGKDKDTFDIEITLRENYQNTKGVKNTLRFFYKKNVHWHKNQYNPVIRMY